MERSEQELIAAASEITHPSDILALTVQEYAVLLNSVSKNHKRTFPDNLLQAIGTTKCSSILVPNDGSKNIFLPGVFKHREGKGLRIDLLQWDEVHTGYKAKSHAVSQLASNFPKGMVLLQFFEDSDNDLVLDIDEITDSSIGLRPVSFAVYANGHECICFPYVDSSKKLPSHLVNIAVTLAGDDGDLFTKHFKSFVEEIPDDKAAFVASIRKSIPEITVAGVQIRISSISISEVVEINQECLC